MEPLLLLGTVIVFGLVVAAVAGFLAARVLMRAADSHPALGGQTRDR